MNSYYVYDGDTYIATVYAYSLREARMIATKVYQDVRWTIVVEAETRHRDD